MCSRWAVIIPFYNEANYLPHCLDCLLKQDLKPDQVILVNNASTDASRCIAENFKKEFSYLFRVDLIDEERKGKINALITGVDTVEADYFATWDADTLYPSNYISIADKVYKKGKGKVVSVMATDIYTEFSSIKTYIRMLGIVLLSHIFRSECHAGGHSETFSLSLFKKAGGFSKERWPYVLEDHEIVECIRHVGKVVYPFGLYSLPSKRRTNHRVVSWTKMEKKVYRFSPFFLKGWFFYKFLGPRLKQRGLFNDRLREQPWQKK